MRISVLMNIVNVAGNALCVFGLGMGVAGVAVPSLIGRALAAADPAAGREPPGAAAGGPAGLPAAGGRHGEAHFEHRRALGF